MKPTGPVTNCWAVASPSEAVQIHGGGIKDDWTWGCIALRNGDMDELFSRDRPRHGGLDCGPRGDLSDLRLDEQADLSNPLELGKWPFRHHLALDLLVNDRTRQKRSHLGRRAAKD